MGGRCGGRSGGLRGLLQFVLESWRRRLVPPFGWQHRVCPGGPVDYEGATAAVHHLDVAAASGGDCSAGDASQLVGTPTGLDHDTHDTHGTTGSPEAASAHITTACGCPDRRGDSDRRFGHDRCHAESAGGHPRDSRKRGGEPVRRRGRRHRWLNCVSTGQLGRSVVFALSTNGTFTASTFAQLAQITPGRHLVVVTAHCGHCSWVPPNNAMIRANCNAATHCTVADWYALAQANPGWFADAPDGVHMPIGGAGGQAYAVMVRQALAA